MKALLSTLSLAGAVTLAAATQDDFYRREVIPLPAGTEAEVGSIALLPEKKLAISTRRGEIWIAEGAYGEDLSQVSWTRFAYGLESSFGMFWKDDALYVTTRTDLSRLQDRDGDGEADRFEIVSQDWGFDATYHQFAFGSEPDQAGDVWVALCQLGGSSKWRGWMIKVAPDGTTTPVASGLRSPGGVGFNAEGETFFTDNQGTWNGTSSVRHAKPGSFLGFPTGFEYYAEIPDQEAPARPNSPSRFPTEMARIPELYPPSVLLPHGRMGASPTFVVLDEKGHLGPFENSLFIGEQSHSQVQRVFTEKVNGVYQGAAWHFLEGFESGLVPGKLADDGTLFVGGTNRGWGSRGTRGFTLERVRWNGQVPFETSQMRALPDGFELTFTETVDPTTAGDPASYAMEAWTYIYQSSYGSPEVDQSTPVIKRATVSPDGLRVRLQVEGLVKGHLHRLDSSGVRSKSGRALWHPVGYYTLNEIPAAPPQAAQTAPPKPPNGWVKLPWEEKKELLVGMFGPSLAEQKQVQEAVPRKAAVPAPEPARVLLFWQCQYPHTSIATGNFALLEMAKRTGAFTITLSDDPADFHPNYLAQFDVVLFNNTTSFEQTIGPDGQKALLSYLKAGGGVVGIHSASDSCRTWPEGVAIMGGIFYCHPWSPKGTWAFQLESPDHPLNRAFDGQGFWHSDEIYLYREGTFDRQHSRVLVSLDMSKEENQTSDQLYQNVAHFIQEDGDYPVSWVHKVGTGRVFYTNFGHNASSFWTPAILQQIHDGIQYAAGHLEAEAIPSAALPEPAPCACAPEAH
ncbi:ThuA domain-containing protein [Roseibacillus ishigakijimensis]|uniref:ThuA domain-containing protein n=1 Tax=Roseibacillus ishigakijimensis TaxID=454146 RepID=A0A934VLI9_9BACT|nr:ThuA domain-containing protein [Roseibacillus ishigakijimensis]MBK1832940.1 ThuA domain-containing protein [Roseibacillus ishigakijimensis]